MPGVRSGLFDSVANRGYAFYIINERKEGMNREDALGEAARKR